MIQVVPDSKRIRITSEGDMLVQLTVLNHSMCVTIGAFFFFSGARTIEPWLYEERGK